MSDLGLDIRYSTFNVYNCQSYLVVRMTVLGMVRNKVWFNDDVIMKFEISSTVYSTVLFCTVLACWIGRECIFNKIGIKCVLFFINFGGGVKVKPDAFSCIEFIVST